MYHKYEKLIAETKQNSADLSNKFSQPEKKAIREIEGKGNKADFFFSTHKAEDDEREEGLGFAYAVGPCGG